MQACINLGLGFDLPLEKQLENIKKAGFSGVFCGWKKGFDTPAFCRQVQAAGLFVQSLHAPFVGVDAMWEAGDAGEAYLAMLKDCVADCAANGVPVAVLHAIIGMEKCTPTDLGIARFDKLCAFADEKGVALAFENTEGLVYLERVFAELSHHRSCRFCWDTGHQMCYNGGADVMARYGHLLAATHLNDNMGQTGDALTWLDDAHMLPFDGIVDWEKACAYLADFDGPITLELRGQNREGRNTHDRYAGMDHLQFVQAAYKCAERIAAR